MVHSLDVMITKFLLPDGTSKTTERIKEVQQEVTKVRTSRSMGIRYREGRGGTAYHVATSSQGGGAVKVVWL